MRSRLCRVCLSAALLISVFNPDLLVARPLSAKSVPQVTEVTQKKSYTKKIKLKWKKVKRAKSYQILVQKLDPATGTLKRAKRVRTTKRRATIKRLKPGTTYYLKVRARKKRRYGPYSDPLKGGTKQKSGVCGKSYAAGKGSVTSLTVPNGKTNSNITFFKSGFSAVDFVPAADLSVTSGVAVSSAEKIYAAGQGTYEVSKSGSVSRIASEGAYYLTFGSDGNLYTDSPNFGNALYRITTAGTSTMIASNLAANIGAFLNLAGSPDGYIYADAGKSSNYSDGNKIIRISIADGSTETVSEQVSGPKVFGSDGTLYILNGTSILKMTSLGQFEEVVCFEYPDDAEPGAFGLAIDENGDFLISEKMPTLSTPALFTNQAGTRVFLVDKYNGNLTTFADGFVGPAGMAFDSDGNLVVAEYVSGSLSLVGASGSSKALVQGHLLSNVDDIAFAPDGSLLIGNTETGMLLKAVSSAALGTTNAPASSSVSLAPYAIGFNLYTGVLGNYAYTSFDKDSNGNIYIAEYAPDVSRKGVSRIAPDGTITTFTTNPDSPNGVAVDSNDNVWISNSVSGKIEKYSSSGSLLGTTAALQTPSDLVYYNGNIYVAEYGGDRIVKVAPDFSTSTYVSGITGPVDLAFSSNGDMVATGGGTVSYVQNPGGGVAVLEVLASYSGSITLQGAVFDASDNLYISVTDGTVVKISGF